MKKFLILNLIIILILTVFLNNIYATNLVITEETLENSFDNFRKISDSNANATIDINKTDKTIKIFNGTENYILNYDLSDKPTFSSDMIILPNMTKDELETSFESAICILIPFLLVSDAANIDFVDSDLYILSKMSENSTLASGNYSDPVLINDKLFTLKSEIDSESSEQIKMKYTLIINTDEDFSIMSGYFDKYIKSFQEITGNTLSQIINTNTNNSISKLPQTGRTLTIKDGLYALISLSIFSIFILLIVDYRYKKNNI